MAEYQPTPSTSHYGSGSGGETSNGQAPADTYYLEPEEVPLEVEEKWDIKYQMDEMVKKVSFLH